MLPNKTKKTFVVEAIIDMRISKGYPIEASSWEPESNLICSLKLIDQFYQKINNPEMKFKKK